MAFGKRTPKSIAGQGPTNTMPDSTDGSQAKGLTKVPRPSSAHYVLTSEMGSNGSG